MNEEDLKRVKKEIKKNSPITKQAIIDAIQVKNTRFVLKSGFLILEKEAKVLEQIEEKCNQIPIVSELDIEDDGVVIRFGNIIQLGIADHYIEKLPDAIGDLQSLEFLDIRENDLETLPESICSLRSLKKLWACGNELLSLPENLGNLHALEELDISMNHLSSIPKSCSDFRSIKVIYSYGCPVTPQSEKIFDTLQAKGCRILK